MATTPQENPDSSKLSGGPGGTKEPEHGSVHPDLVNDKSKAKPNEEPPKVKYELNGKSFESAEEMSKYVADLEKKAVQQPQTYVPPIPTVQVPTKEMIDGRPIDELLFENPTKVLQYMEAKVEQKFNQRLQQDENKKTFWTNFYSENQDLKGKEFIVDALISKHEKEWGPLSVKDFSKVVANETRSTLKKIGLANAQELPNNKSVALSSGGEAPHTPRNDEGDKSVSFIDQVRQMRRRANKK